jgi:hypothetical protein
MFTNREGLARYGVSCTGQLHMYLLQNDFEVMIMSKQSSTEKYICIIKHHSFLITVCVRVCVCVCVCVCVLWCEYVQTSIYKERSFGVGK